MFLIDWKENLNMRRKRYMYNVGVLLDEATYLRLVAITKEERIPKSRFCRELLREKLNTTQEEKKAIFGCTGCVLTMIVISRLGSRVITSAGIPLIRSSLKTRFQRTLCASLKEVDWCIMAAAAMQIIPTSI